MCVNCDIDFKSLETEFGTNRVSSWVAMGVLFGFDACAEAQRSAAQFLVALEANNYPVLLTDSNLILLLTSFPGDLLFKFLFYRTPIVNSEDFFKEVAEKISPDNAVLFCRAFLSVEPITAKFVARNWVLVSFFFAIARSIPPNVFGGILKEVTNQMGKEHFKHFGKDVLRFISNHGGNDEKID